MATAFGSLAAMVVSGTLAARLLGPQDRGYLALFVTVPSVACQLGAMGLSLAVTYFIASGRASAADMRALILRPAMLQICALTIVAGAVLVGYALSQNSRILAAAGLMTLQVPATMAAEYGLAIIQGERRYRTYNLLRGLSPMLYAASLIPLFLLDLDELVIVAAAVVGTSAVTAVWAVRLARNGPDEALRLEEPVTLREVIKFGTRGYFGYLAPIDTFRIDQLVVGLAVSPRALGFYVVGAAFTNLPRAVAHNVGMTAAPHVASRPTDEQQMRAIRRFTLFVVLISAVVSCALIAGSGLLIPLLFGDAYKPSISVARILLVGAFFFAVKRVLVDAMRGAGEAMAGTRAEVAATAVFALLCILLTGAHGAHGVALAFTVSGAVGAAVLSASLARAGVLTGRATD